MAPLSRKRAWWLILILGCGQADIVTPPPPPAALSKGEVVLNTSTTGDTPDPNGYQVFVDFSLYSVPISGQTILKIDPGQHTVRLTDIARNCVVESPNPVTIEVTAGGHVAIDFQLSCPTPTKGDLLLTTITTGSRPDPNGYVILLGTEHYALGIAGEVTLTLDPGRYEVQITDLADNCVLLSPNPVSVEVAAGGISGVTFSLSCTAIATLTVTTATSGTNRDPDGYVLSLNGAAQSRMDPDAQLTLHPSPGSYTIRLSDLASNCWEGGGGVRQLALAEGQSATLNFQVSCAQPLDDTPGEKLVVSSRAPGNSDFDLYLMEASGGLRQRLTDDLSDDLVPEFSSNAEKLLFIRWNGAQNKLVLMDRATRALTTLATSNVGRAVWSPDGSQIAFLRNGRIYVMNSDGSGERVLTNGSADADPYWSRDGSRIAFTRDTRVWIVDATGTNPHPVSGSNRSSGPWSPDGGTLIITYSEYNCSYYYYYYYGCYPVGLDFRLLDVASGTEVPLTATPQVQEWSPVWSTDGQTVYFISAGDVYRIRRDGSQRVNVTNSPDTEQWVTLGNVQSAGAGVRALRRRP